MRETREKPYISLAEALGIPPVADISEDGFVAAIVGGGGKTSLMLALARELSQIGGAIMTTTTHIARDTWDTLSDGADAEEIRAELNKRGVALVAAECEDAASGRRKLTAGKTPLDKLRRLAPYTIVEADGSKGLPLKAHASHEPAIPEGADLVIGVIGADGFNKTPREAAHRSALYAEALGIGEDDAITPELAARAADMHMPRGVAVINKVDAAEDMANARRFAQAYSGKTVALSLKNSALPLAVWERRKLVAIRGAGDLATGVAIRLKRARCDIVMTDIAKPTAIRRTVAFSEAIYDGAATVENVRARRARDASDALRIIGAGEVAVLVDPDFTEAGKLQMDAVVDAILAKTNLGTSMTMAKTVVALGPGFTAGVDCHAVIETQRGHDLGRVFYSGTASANTGIPGEIGGKSAERVIRAGADGEMRNLRKIGDVVSAGEVVATVNGKNVTSNIAGVLRGLIRDGAEVTLGMKVGDTDPRGVIENCATVSDKARALGGAVLEALMHFSE